RASTGRNVFNANLIASSQGFFVKAKDTSGNLVFRESHKLASPPSAVYANFRTQAESKLIKLDVSDGINSNQAVVVFDELALDSYEIRDAEMLSSGDLLIYTTITSPSFKKLSLNSLAWPRTSNLSVPVIVDTKIL